jgi:hypothetical protein
MPVDVIRRSWQALECLAQEGIAPLPQYGPVEVGVALSADGGPAPKPHPLAVSRSSRCRPKPEVAHVFLV